MTTPQAGTQEREALQESERQASRTQPENFKDSETDEKIVEVLPVDGEGTAIRGIDPKT
jgi:hypothetical protein